MSTGIRSFVHTLTALCTLTAAAHAAAAKPTAPPAELIAMAARGPASGLDGIRAFANAVQPGAGVMINDATIDGALTGIVGVPSLDAFDHASPMYVLYVDGGGAKGFALVGKVLDATQLHASTGSIVAAEGGWAIVGAAPVVKKVKDYALAALPKQPAPTQPALTLFVGQALARYHNDVVSARAMMVASTRASHVPNADVAGDIFDGTMAVAADADRAVLTFDADPSRLAIDFALVPRPGTKLATFVATQRPSNYALLDRLPATAAGAMVMAGHLEAGPYHDAFISLITRVYGGGAKDLMAATDELMKASSAELAGSFSMAPGTSPAMTYLYGIADRKTNDRVLARIVSLYAKGLTVDSMGFHATMKPSAAIPDHDGVALHGYDTVFDLSKLPEPTRSQMQQMFGGGSSLHGVLAAVDDLDLITSGPSADTAAAATIDVVRGHGSHFAPGKDVAAALVASRARKDSVVITLDLGAMATAMGTPGAAPKGTIVMTLGFADGAAHLRTEVQAATFHAHP